MSNLQDTRLFFDFLRSNTDEVFAASFFQTNDKNIIPGMGTVMAKADELIHTYESLNGSAGAAPTLHVALNQTSHKGRRTAHILAPRVLCADLDEPIDRDQLKDYVANYKPHMVVESSPNKYHIYWKIQSNIKLEHWSKYQLAINGYFNGDLSLDSITHTIRVPGIDRITKDGERYTPKIIFFVGEYAPLTEVEIGAYFPWVNSEYSKALKKRKEKNKELKKAIKSGGPINPGIAGRNTTLYNAVKDLLSEVHNDGEGGLLDCLPYEAVLEYARGINQQFAAESKGPLEESEFEKTVISAYERGKSLHEYKVEKIKKLSGHTSSTEATAASSVRLSSTQISSGYEPYDYDYQDALLDSNRFTDLAHYARIMQRYNNEMLRAGGTFYAFNMDNRVWHRQTSTEHKELFHFYKTCAMDTVRDPQFIQDLCLDAEGVVSESKMRRMQEKYMSLRMHGLTVKAVLNSTEVTEADSDIFDADPYKFYVGNGLVDLITHETRQVQSTDYLLSQSPVIWTQDATCPFFEEFIYDVFSENANPDEMYRFMQELFGYSLSGSIHEQKIFCHYGDGSNGKSKVLYALSTLTGDYGTYIDPDDLVMSKHSQSKSFERFGIKTEGKRTVIVDDIDVETIWNESFVKNITGPVIRARALYKESRTFSNRAKIHLGLNVAPKPQAENYGILRRLCFIPYPKRFDVDPHMSELIETKIREESSGILSWASEGLRRVVLQSGIKYPEELTVAIEEYKAEHFKFETILDELFERLETDDKTQWSFVTDLAQDVEHYLASNGTPQQVTANQVSDALRRKWRMDGGKKWCNKRKNSYKAFPVKSKITRDPLTEIRYV